MATKSKPKSPFYRKSVSGPYISTQREYESRPHTVATWEGFSISVKRFRDPEEAKQWADCERKRLKIRAPKTTVTK